MSEEAKLEFPSTKDLLAQLQFDSNEGKIWLNERRMLLFHSSAMSSLRKELIDTLGIERTKGFLMRFGFQSGMKDAELAQKVRPDLTSADAFFVGPQLHCIKGMVRVEPIELEFDVEKGEFYGEFDWHDSYEVEAHISEFGHSDSPVCWELIGYASGYSSYYMGRKIIFKETCCAGTGADCCHIIGKPAAEWEDQEELERYLMPDSVTEELFSLHRQIDNLKASFRTPSVDDDFLINSVGRSGAFRNVCHLIKKASKSKITVLLQGETGVGKEVVARGLHSSSDRAEAPFIAVNCACIPPDLIEAELFGVEKGAFTGATQSREGKFERANQGTIFLDEVIELSPRAQATLLRVLQESELERVGDNRTRRIDVRVVAATNEDLEEAVKKGKFRADLYYRLNVYPVYIPPLRERVEDIALLIEHFLTKYHTLYNKKTLGVSERASQALAHYKWPGNIRELENMIERGVILAENNQTIDLECFFPSLAEPSHPLNVINSKGRLDNRSDSDACDSSESIYDKLIDDGIEMEAFENQLIAAAMERADGNVSKAARLLGLTRPALAYRLKKQ